MVRPKPVRTAQTSRSLPALVKSTQAGFWVTLALAILLGGGQAASGVPAFLGVILPTGVGAANASAVAHEPMVRIAIEPEQPALRGSLR
jgi:hypothetical protein